MVDVLQPTTTTILFILIVVSTYYAMNNPSKAANIAANILNTLGKIVYGLIIAITRFITALFNMIRRMFKK